MSEKRKQKEARRAARRDAEKRHKASRVRRDAQGRTHLVVYRDALGRTERLGLSEALFEHAWQNELAVAAASTAHALLGEGRSLARAVELGRSAMSATSRIVEGAMAPSPERRAACQPGCAHCCHQAVGATPPEVFAIYEHLRASRAPDAFEALVRRLREADDRTRGMTAAERFSPELPCPLLERDRCSIYEVRPLACRGKNSLDAAECERTLRDPDGRAELFAGKATVPCFVEPLRAFHAITAGMQLALAELHGLGMEPLELTAALRLLLDAPEAVPAAWLAGHDPFEAARGGDATRNAELGELAGVKLRPS